MSRALTAATLALLVWALVPPPDRAGAAEPAHGFAPETSPRPVPRTLCRPSPFPDFCVVPSTWAP